MHHALNLVKKLKEARDSHEQIDDIYHDLIFVKLQTFIADVR